MPFVQLSLSSLGQIDDGRVDKAFAQALRRCVQDCLDRPGDKKARSVGMQANITPVITLDGGVLELEGVQIEFQIKDKVPDRKSKTYSFKHNNKGELKYSSNSPEDVDQATFEDVDPKTGKVNRKPRDEE